MFVLWDDNAAGVKAYYASGDEDQVVGMEMSKRMSKCSNCNEKMVRKAYTGL